MAKARATASGVHRRIGARWLLKVSAPRRGLLTRYATCDGLTRHTTGNSCHRAGSRRIYMDGVPPSGGCPSLA
jgi:hypothetical protein